MRSPTRRRLHPAACVALACLLAAAPPEVVRLRVPSARVQTWFPPGTELKGMSAGSFEDLLRAVKAASLNGAQAEGPRLLKAKHEARWEDGELVGRSELVIDPPKSVAGALVLEPWTPAVDAAEPGTVPVQSDDAGRSSIRVEPVARDGGAVKAAVAWRLRARPGSRGRKFALGLPGREACELSLDLPVGLEPEGPPGLRQGPSSTTDPRHAAGGSSAGSARSTCDFLTPTQGTTTSTPPDLGRRADPRRGRRVDRTGRSTGRSAVARGGSPARCRARPGSRTPNGDRPGGGRLPHRDRP